MPNQLCYLGHYTAAVVQAPLCQLCAFPAGAEFLAQPSGGVGDLCALRWRCALGRGSGFLILSVS